MTFRDTVQLALRNLGQAKLRTSLTTLGVSIGIASLAGMVSLGVGLQDQFVGRFTKSGVFDAITVTPGQDLPGFMAGGRGGRGGRRGGFGSQRRAARGAAHRPTRLPPDDDDARSRSSRRSGGQGRLPEPARPGGTEIRPELGGAIAGGVPMSAAGRRRVSDDCVGGTFFANDTDNACLLSLDMAKRISDARSEGLIGKDADAGARRVGVDRRTGDAGAGFPIRCRSRRESHHDRRHRRARDRALRRRRGDFGPDDSSRARQGDECRHEDGGRRCCASPPEKRPRR